MARFEITYERTLLVKIQVEADSEAAARERYEAADFTAQEVMGSTSQVTEENLLTVKEIK
jgi:hypothetical protein